MTTTIIFNFHDCRHNCDRTFYKTVWSKDVTEQTVENLKASAFASMGMSDKDATQESVIFR